MTVIFILLITCDNGVFHGEKKFAGINKGGVQYIDYKREYRGVLLFKTYVNFDTSTILCARIEKSNIRDLLMIISVVF